MEPRYLARVWIWAAAAGLILLGSAIIWVLRPVNDAVRDRTVRRDEIVHVEPPNSPPPLDPAVSVKDAVLVIENLPADAVVAVDGAEMPASSPGVGPRRFVLSPGRHGVLVIQRNDLLLGESVMLEPGSEHKLAIPVKELRKEQPPPPLRPGPPVPSVPPPPGRRPNPPPKIELVRIEAGEFLMGSPADDKDAISDEKPQHKVRISSFLLGKTEVTQAQYVAVMGNNPSRFSRPLDLKRNADPRSSELRPVENVSWYDALRFCNALSKRDGLAPYYENDRGGVPNERGPGYRLPTEAEWEYACRAGTRTKYCFGNDPKKLGDFAWYAADSGGETQPVATRLSNPWGLFDMHGNVWEWCGDRYAMGYYQSARTQDPRADFIGARRVCRGGGILEGPRNCRSARRYVFSPDYLYQCLGFRVARNEPRR